MACLTQQDFLDWSGYSLSAINSDYLSELLLSIESIILDEIGDNFTLRPITEGNAVRYVGANMDLRKIGVWQTGITVSRGSFGELTSSALTVDKDYIELYVDDALTDTETRPVYAIRLINSILSNNSFITVYGTRGYQDGCPQDLTNLIYEIIKAKLEYNQQLTDSAGSGTIKSEKDLTTSITYGDVRPTESADALAFDVARAPQVRELIHRYKQYAMSVGSTIS